MLIHAEISEIDLLKEKIAENREDSDTIYKLAMLYHYDRNNLNLELAKYYMIIAANKNHLDAFFIRVGYDVCARREDIPNR